VTLPALTTGKLTAGKKTWLIYKRLRVSIGTFGLVLCFGAFAGVLSAALLQAAVGFALIELFGAAYNDYTDYEEDLRNQRIEKLTVSGFLTPAEVRALAVLALVAGLAVELAIDRRLFALGLYYGTFLFLYSHPSVFLKKYNVAGYAVVESFWLLMPFALSTVSAPPRGGLQGSTVLFAAFGFFQCVYFLCQKDSTDAHDRTNLFLARGWLKASVIVAMMAALASISLLLLAWQGPGAPVVLLIWTANLLDKVVNCTLIWRRRIERQLRSRLVLFEFLTPFGCALVWLLAR